VDAPMDKAKLIDKLRAARSEWDDLIKQGPIERMEEPGVVGDWSLKNIMSHLTWHERWYADRMQERLRGEGYTPTEMETLDFDRRNDIVYRQNRDRPLADVLADSEETSRRLVEMAQANSEEFLIEPQQFEGVPVPIIIWKNLRGDVYDHYHTHAQDVRAWLDRAGA